MMLLGLLALRFASHACLAAISVMKISLAYAAFCWIDRVTE
jgi:hypothetical protein